MYHEQHERGLLLRKAWAAHQIKIGVAQTVPQLRRQYDRTIARYVESGKHVPDFLKRDPAFRFSAPARELLRGAMQIYGERLADVANEARVLTGMEGIHEKHVDFAVNMTTATGSTFFGN